MVALNGVNVDVCLNDQTNQNAQWGEVEMEVPFYDSDELPSPIVPKL